MAKHLQFSESKLRLSYAILKHLQKDMDSGSLSPDQTESLEVAVMCLQTVYGLDLEDKACVAKYGASRSLQELFQQDEQATQSNKDEAEKLKNQGNAALKAEKFDEAVEMYTKAITLDPSNATYYSNRAAAYIKLKELQKALEDCQHAVLLNPNYARAHGRMGFVYSSLNEWVKARDCYKKCIELDPENAEYKTNLDVAEQRVQHLEQQQQQQSEPQIPGLGALGGALPNLAGADIAGLMSNPAFMNLASSVMNNPSFQQMAANMLGSQMGAAGAGAGDGEGEGDMPPGPAGMLGMMPRIQEMARQMQQNNPSMYQNLQQEATRFQEQMRQQQPPSDKEEEDEKKEGNQ